VSTDEETRRSISDDLKHRGFEAGEPVYSDVCPFNLQELMDSFAFGTSNTPRVLFVGIGDGRFAFVVGRLEKVYVGQQGSTVHFYPLPDWRFEGWLMNENFSPQPGKYQVRGYIEANGEHFSGLEIQRIPANPDPDGLIEVLNE
jgi:hypothetical protein